MTIIRPETEFSQTPENFSRESDILAIKSEDYKQGIILNTIEEVAYALSLYSWNDIRDSMKRHNLPINAIAESHGAIAAGAAILSRALTPDTVPKDLIDEMISSLKLEKTFHKSYDYDAFGTSFFKTSVWADLIGDKYVLHLSNGNYRDGPDARIADVIGKQVAIANTRAIIKYEIVDGWWFNINIDNVLQKLPLSKGQRDSIRNYLSDHYNKRPEISFNHEGQSFSIDTSLDANCLARPANESKTTQRYLQHRGSHIVGSAWDTWQDKLDMPASLKSPELMFIVYLTEDSSVRTPAITEKQMQSLQNARNHLVTYLLQDK